jgi:proline iminopeptidase
MPIDEWPEAINRSFDHMNPNVYVYMQGPSEFGITGDASLKDWDVTAQLKR